MNHDFLFSGYLKLKLRVRQDIELVIFSLIFQLGMLEIHKGTVTLGNTNIKFGTVNHAILVMEWSMGLFKNQFCDYCKMRGGGVRCNSTLQKTIGKDGVNTIEI